MAHFDVVCHCLAFGSERETAILFVIHITPGSEAPGRPVLLMIIIHNTFYLTKEFNYRNRLETWQRQKHFRKQITTGLLPAAQPQRLATSRWKGCTGRWPCRIT